jgi:very-short-patch-repair endonuclease
MPRITDERAISSPPPERGRSASEARRVGVDPASRFNRTPAKTVRARKLRRGYTEVEMRVWQKLRNRQLGVDFRRQHPVGNFVLDFYAPALRLAIEFDGGQHSENATVVHDEMRSRWLVEHGVTMLRFWNSDVIQNLSGVLEAISSKITELDASRVGPTRRWRADLPLSGGGNKPTGSA